MGGRSVPESTRFPTPLGLLDLRRRPHVTDGSLLAWDAADSLLLSAFAELDLGRIARVLVVNDSFGALAVPLVRGGWSVTSWTDSRLTQIASAENLRRNGLAEDAVHMVASTETLAAAFDVVLWKLPSSADVLAVTIDELAPTLRGAIVIAGGMDKYTPPMARDVLSALGSCVMRKGEKKAHLFDVRVETDDPPVRLPPVAEFGSEFGLSLVGSAGVFGSDSVDLGSRVLLDALQVSAVRGEFAHIQRVADLGCGGGVLGLGLAAQMGREWTGSITFLDDSFRALATARQNAERNQCVHAEFQADDSLTNYHGAPFDTIVCNPPFHQRGAVSDAIAWQMMRQSLHHLADGGALWVVGNRHLGYHAKLARLFGNCEVRSEHPKFVVCHAVKEVKAPTIRSNVAP